MALDALLRAATINPYDKATLGNLSAVFVALRRPYDSLRLLEYAAAAPQAPPPVREAYSEIRRSIGTNLKYHDSAESLILWLQLLRDANNAEATLMVQRASKRLFS
jgi:hypothetical protein